MGVSYLAGKGAEGGEIAYAQPVELREAVVDAGEDDEAEEDQRDQVGDDGDGGEKETPRSRHLCDWYAVKERRVEV